jgi:hypothetical protein
MITDPVRFDAAHRMDEYATRPIARLAPRPAALLLLAGMSLPPDRSKAGVLPLGGTGAQRQGCPANPPRRRALPADPPDAHSNASNYRF